MRLCGPGPHEGRHEPPRHPLSGTSPEGLAGGRARRGRTGPGLRPPGRAEVPNRGRGKAQDGLRGHRLRRRRSPPARRRVGRRGGRRRRQTQPLRRGQRRPVGQAGRDHAAKPRHRGRRHEDRRHRRAGQTISKGHPQRRDRDVRPGSGLGEDRARVEAEGRLPRAAGPRHDGGIDRTGQEVPGLQRRGHFGRAAGAARSEPQDDRRDQDPADYGRLQGAERHRAGPVRRRPSSRSATSACRWIRVSPPRPT